ncbi:hypothetical protein [Streptomyces tanashiensis]
MEGPSAVLLSGEDVHGLLADLGRPDDSVLDLGGIATARGQGVTGG